MTRLVLGPFNRVEGDLEVRLDVEDGTVAAAFVNAPLYRGFETLLIGRDPRDAMVIAPRICGICSVAQSAAAAKALADLAGVTPPENGRLAANIVKAAENVADHLTHFHIFFMPDFARQDYADRAWHPAALGAFKAGRGEAAAAFLAARARFLHLMGILAGKWPHTLALQPGGTTKAVDTGEKMRLTSILSAFRDYLERHVFADSLERIAALRDHAALEAWREEAPPQQGAFRLFLSIARDLGLERLGRVSLPMMSYGAFPGADGTLGLPAGIFAQGRAHSLDLDGLREETAHSWVSGEALHPAWGATLPDADKAGAYSWSKAPRLDGSPVEVGALARQVLAGHPLARDLVAVGHSSVLARVVARMVETALLVISMEQWIAALRPREPFMAPMPKPEQGTGVGLVEAARGGLGHWLTIADGRIARYQIVAPTTWNFSPRDAAGVPGPLEQALVGAPVGEGEETPVSVQHVIRSFDPCMVCTVH